METIAKHIALARRRLFIARFVRALSWTASAMFVAAAVAIAAGKLWPPAVSQSAWIVGWLVGAGVAGVFAAAIVAWRTQGGPLAAAIEIDHRLGLEARVATAMGIGSEEAATPMGQALVRDAEKRLDRSSIPSFFPAARLDRTACAPLLALLLAAGIGWWAPLRERAPEAAAAESRQQVAEATKKLEQKLAKKRVEAQEQGLADADHLLKKLEEGTRDLNSQKSGEKQALTQLNDLGKELAVRRESLEHEKAVKQRLGELGAMDRGPAEKMAGALKRGDLEAGQKELKKLEEKLANDKLAPEERQALGKQLGEMQKQLERAAVAHEQAAKDVERQLAAAKAAGDKAAQQALEARRDELRKQDGAMKQLKQMAQQLGKAGECAKQGQCDAAKEALAQMREDLGNMQKADAEMAMLDDAMDQIRDAKASMACKQCQGKGCKACQGGEGEADDDGHGNHDGKQNAKAGKGRGGQGAGVGGAQHRGSEMKAKTGFYDSQVSQKVGAGAGTIEGHARGPNRKGQTLEEIKEHFAAAGHEADDPLTNHQLPRDYREQAKRYFELLRGEEE